MFMSAGDGRKRHKKEEFPKSQNQDILTGVRKYFEMKDTLHRRGRRLDRSKYGHGHIRFCAPEML